MTGGVDDHLSANVILVLGALAAKWPGPIPAPVWELYLERPRTTYQERLSNAAGAGPDLRECNHLVLAISRETNMS